MNNSQVVELKKCENYMNRFFLKNTFIKVFFKINLFIKFYILKLNNLRVIHDLYFQGLTQILFKMSIILDMEGVASFKL